MTMAAWLILPGAAAMIAVVTLYALRIVMGAFRGTPLSWDTEAIHLGMALAMAGMLDPGLAIVPPHVWLALFAAAGTWFAVRSALAARRQLSGQLLGGTLVHVGGCAAMVYMLAVAPPSGNMVDMADLICGARTIGMQATGSSSAGTPWTGPALALAVVLIAGAACAALPRFRSLGMGEPVEFGTERTLGFLFPLGSTRLVLGAQAAMCLVMTATLVAMYR